MVLVGTGTPEITRKTCGFMIRRQARLPIKNKSASSSDSDFCGKGHGKSGVPAALHKAPIFPTGKEGQQEDMPSSCLKLKIPTGQVGAFALGH